eukprot:c18642_g1_i2 orf=421-1068(+)
MGAPAPSPEEPHSTTKLDIVVVVLIALGGAMMILGNAVILYYRSYRPIKSKSVQLTLLSSVGGLIWISSSLVVNDHFARKKALALCALWTYWLQACFGFGLWLNCLTLRLITLYRIFICKCDTTTYDYAFIIPLLLPIIAICIGGTVKKNLRKKSSGANLKMLAQLEEVRTQVKIYKDRIDQLEEEVKALEQEYSARQQKTSSQSSPNGREIELC